MVKTMNFTFKKLQQDNAIIIANEWKYEEPYSFYDMTADPDDYNEIVNEALRNESVYLEAILNNELAGFFCLEIEENEIEIGLGLKPSLCGKGIGKEFLNCIIFYINQNYSYNLLSMSVASFNKRAIKVYESCGFKKQITFMQETNGGVYEFIKMIKEK